MVVKFVPSNCTAVMMTTAIEAAIRPYSMAVAPDSALTKLRMKRLMEPPCETPNATLQTPRIGRAGSREDERRKFKQRRASGVAPRFGGVLRTSVAIFVTATCRFFP